MVERTAALAARTGVKLHAAVVPWCDLGGQAWGARFEAVFCVGNSLMHAPGTKGRTQALRNMAAVTAAGGRLAITSRNWELVRETGSAIDVAPAVLERGGRRGILIHNWIVAEEWEQQHELHIAVALLDPDGDGVETVSERLTFWPFRHGQLQSELRDAGYAIEQSTYDPGVERYLVTALRSA